MKLKWTDRASRDLRKIGRYIARDNPGAARRWVERLRQRARLAAAMPQTGRRLPEAPGVDVREVILGSYRIVYRLVPGAFEVIMVLEGHRLLTGDEIDSRLDSA